MPVVAAAPEKITPLIKRLRVSLEFTDIAPFFVVFECMLNPYNLHAYLPRLYLPSRLLVFASESNKFAGAYLPKRPEIREPPSDCSVKITHCHNIDVLVA